MPNGLTLFMQLSSKCSIGCAFCPWKEFLDESDLDSGFISLLDRGDFERVVITCPWSENLATFSEEIKKRGIGFFYLLHSRSVRPTRVLLEADELFFLVDYAEDVERMRDYVMMLLSHGYEKINFIMQLIPGINSADLQQILATCNKWGVRLWISPPLFKCDSNVDLERILKVRLSQKSFDFLGAFSATPAIVGESPLFLISSKRDKNCKILFLSPSGLRRCPNSGVVPDIPEDMSCPVGRRKPFLFVTRIYLITSKGEFDERDVMLLDLIDRMGSIRGAARQLGISISTACERIKAMEESIGADLTKTCRGGHEKGHTVLTEEGKRIVDEYRRIRRKTT
ncbi:MAG: winged helix-turn-helix domain-containing protein [Candidatus Methanodesulfokora sp.]